MLGFFGSLKLGRFLFIFVVHYFVGRTFKRKGVIYSSPEGGKSHLLEEPSLDIRDQQSLKVCCIYY